MALSPGIQRRIVRWKSTNVSEEHVASIFRDKEYAKQGTSVLAIIRSNSVPKYINVQLLEPIKNIVSNHIAS
jgi:hypothetical protein